MARIRTIKPEFPQSESMGRVSREARLTFVLLWTICDDSGRTRGSSRMLASLLYPYDDDAIGLIDGWLSELESENCIIRYQIDNAWYLQIRKWLEHQKIDKPSKSKLPEFANIREASRESREGSSWDLGPRTKDLGPRKGTKDQDQDQDQDLGKGGGEGPDLDRPPAAFSPAPPDDVLDFWIWFQTQAIDRGIPVPKTLTDERRKKIAARLRIPEWRPIVGEALAKLPLGGTWQPDIDWIIENDNHACKVAEGSYDGWGEAKPKKAPSVAKLLGKAK